eukprot:5396449-Pleurochrysis_carterae.AAC.3
MMLIWGRKYWTRSCHSQRRSFGSCLLQNAMHWGEFLPACGNEEILAGCKKSSAETSPEDSRPSTALTFPSNDIYEKTL